MVPWPTLPAMLRAFYKDIEWGRDVRGVDDADQGGLREAGYVLAAGKRERECQRE